MSRRRHILHEAGIKRRRILLDLDIVSLRQGGIRVAPDKSHQPFASGTGPLKPGDFRILVGQYRRQNGQSLRLKILPEQVALLTEGFHVPAEEQINDQPDSWGEDQHEHPGQGGLRPPVLQDDEHGHHERIEAKRGRQDRAHILHAGSSWTRGVTLLSMEAQPAIF